MHNSAQVELQLDWSQLPYSEYSDPSSQKVAHPNAQYKKGPYTGWKEKLLSNAKKEDLIKAVAQAVTSYTMSVGAFSDRIGLPLAVTGWAASCDGGP